jgi:hypothetical protein
MVNGKLMMVLMVPGLPKTKVVDGLALMKQLLADGTLTKTANSLEPGGAMTTTKEEPGLLKMQHLTLKPLQSQSTSNLVPGSLQMALLKELGKWIPWNQQVAGPLLMEPLVASIWTMIPRSLDLGGQAVITPVANQELGL